MNDEQPVVWFPTVRVGTGSDRFTERLVAVLKKRGIQSLITWLPRRAEYAPWTVPIPRPPKRANIAHINSWIHRRFIPSSLPLVVTIHGCIHDPELSPYKKLPQALYHRLWVRNCENYSISCASAVTAVSQYTAKRSAIVFERDDIVTIYNWIDINDFKPVARLVPNHPFRLLFVGNLSRRKGMDLLPEIMSRLGNDFELYYTGSVSELGNELPNMIPLGFVDKVTALIHLFQKSDALLFPSRLEGFGLVALEAQACGCPVITTDGSSLPEVIEDGKTGILCPKDDINAFVEAARKLRANLDTWQTMRLQGRNRAISTFNENSAIDQYLEIYRQILSTMAKITR